MAIAEGGACIVTGTDGFVAVLLVAVVIAQILLTVRVWRSRSYDREQKMAQTRLIWLLPVIGAVLVFGLMPPEDDPSSGRTDRDKC